DADEIPKLIEDLREGLFQGFNVTTPYKEVVIPFLDRLSNTASRIGAVNTIYIRNGEVVGDNTDYDGFAGLLENYQIDVSNKRVYILGTGGAARAAYYVLSDLKAIVTVVSRNLGKNKEKFEKVIEYKDIDSKNVDIYIQATPIGTYPNTNVSVLTKEEVSGKTVIDLVYNPPITQIMKDSKKGINGLMMLIIQAIKSDEIWFDSEIEMTKELIETLKEVIYDE
ncbi:MAG: shikimate dehydrogenase, partial [Acholeplasmataceae bacterium]|nr:shikimate dehydrogenase [Acholeplasmataceae bacterium]